MSLTTEVKSLLTATVSNIFIGSMPATPDAAVCVYATGGYPRSLSGTELEELTFQIKARNLSYASAETICNTINDLLNGASTTKVLMIQNQSGILDLGRDESNRTEMSMNFRCYYRR